MRSEIDLLTRNPIYQSNVILPEYHLDYGVAVVLLKNQIQNLRQSQPPPVRNLRQVEKRNINVDVRNLISILRVKGICCI